MARPREFDIDEAVEKAMQAFWKHGYEGTSLPDLLEATGLSRGSLYKAFGSKKALFMAALAKYDALYITPGAQKLRDPSLSGEARLAALFAGAVEVANSGDRRGCLLCNTAAGVSYDDAEIEAVVNGQMDRLSEAIAVALADHDDYRGMSEEKRARQARAIALSYVGLRVSVRAGVSPKLLAAAVEGAVGEAHTPASG